MTRNNGIWDGARHAVTSGLNFAGQSMKLMSTLRPTGFALKLLDNGANGFSTWMEVT